MRCINLKYNKSFHYYGMSINFDYVEFEDSKAYFWRKIEDTKILVSSIISNKRIKFDFIADVSENYKIVSFEFSNKVLNK